MRVSKPKSKRVIMRENNTHARMYLVKHGFTHIWLKQHTRFLDSVWSHIGEDGKVIKYKAIDIWNLFDGIAVDKYGRMVFLAISDRWKGEDEILKFFTGKRDMRCVMINVIDKTNIKTRNYKTSCR